MPQIKDHLGDFDQEEDFQLDHLGAAGLRTFLRGPYFLHFLAALDLDRERVALREEEGESMLKLQESNDDLLNYHLKKWIEDEGHLDPADYESTKMPGPALPMKDLVSLKNILMPQGLLDNDLTPANLYDLAIYSQLTNLKVNMLLDMVTAQGLVVQNSAPGWDDMVLKFPFLSQCDDHVRNVPRGTPLQLSRTRAMGTHTKPTTIPHRAWLFARHKLKICYDFLCYSCFYTQSICFLLRFLCVSVYFFMF